MAQYKIEVPDTDRDGKIIDVHRFMDALYGTFGWEKGSIRLLVAETIPPKRKPLPKIPIGKISIEQSH